MVYQVWVLVREWDRPPLLAYGIAVPQRLRSPTATQRVSNIAIDGFCSTDLSVVYLCLQQWKEVSLGPSGARDFCPFACSPRDFSNLRFQVTHCLYGNRKYQDPG